MTQDTRSVLPVDSIGAGKTMFRQCLQGLPVEHAKTQAIETFASAIDTPGEYLKVRRYKHALMLVSYDVDMVVLVQSATDDETRFPSGFATTLNRGVLGVITHMGVATEAQVHNAVDRLARARAHRIVTVNSVTGKGFRRVREVLYRTSS